MPGSVWTIAPNWPRYSVSVSGKISAGDAAAVKTVCRKWGPVCPVRLEGDSSTIVGVMARTHPERINDIHTFGSATSELEPMFTLQTSLAHGIEHNHILTSPPTPRCVQTCSPNAGSPSAPSRQPARTPRTAESTTSYSATGYRP